MQTMAQKERYRGMLMGLFGAIVMLFPSMFLMDEMYGRIRIEETLMTLLPMFLAGGITLGADFIGVKNGIISERLKGSLLTLAPMLAANFIMFVCCIVNFEDDMREPFTIGIAYVLAIAAIMIMLFMTARGRNRKALLVSAYAVAVPCAVISLIMIIGFSVDSTIFWLNDVMRTIIILGSVCFLGIAVIGLLMPKHRAGRPHVHDSLCAQLVNNQSLIFEGRVSHLRGGSYKNGYMFLMSKFLFIRTDVNGSGDYSIQLKNIISIGKLSGFGMAVCTDNGMIEKFKVDEVEEWIVMLTRAVYAANGGVPLRPYETIMAARTAVPPVQNVAYPVQNNVPVQNTVPVQNDVRQDGVN